MASRFWDALRSGWSVAVLFRKRIAEGRPVTVKHPEATTLYDHTRGSAVGDADRQGPPARAERSPF